MTDTNLSHSPWPGRLEEAQAKTALEGSNVLFRDWSNIFQDIIIYNSFRIAKHQSQSINIKFVDLQSK